MNIPHMTGRDIILHDIVITHIQGLRHHVVKIITTLDSFTKAVISQTTEEERQDTYNDQTGQQEKRHG